MAVISGVLRSPHGGVKTEVTIVIKPKKPDSYVLGNSELSTMTDVDGRYSMDVLPGHYEVIILEEATLTKLGEIKVNTDSEAGTLSDFLLQPGESELISESLKTVDDYQYGGVISAAEEEKTDVQPAHDSIGEGTVSGVIDANNTPLFWDNSEDPKVITALRNGLLEVFSGISFNSAVKVDDAVGREIRISRVFNPETDTPVLWDSSEDPKVLLFIDKDGKIQAPKGFGSPGGNIPVSLEMTANSYVSQSIRAILHSVASNMVGDRNVRILLTGHSWTDFLEIPKAYRDMLQSKYGDGGIGYQSFNPTRIPDGMTCVQTGFTARTIYNAVTSEGTGVNGRSLYTTTNTSMVRFDGLKGTRMTVYYQDLNGSFKIKVSDGGRDKLVAVIGGSTNKFKSVVIDLDTEEHCCEIDTSSNVDGNKVNIFGVDMSYQSGVGVSVYSMGNAGCHAHDYDKCTPNYADVVPVVRPDCVLILLGTNEAINKIPPATYKIYLRRLVNAWKNNLPKGVGVNIVSCAHTLNTSNSVTQDKYPAIERELALELGVGYVDGYHIFPQPPISNDARLFANTEHLNDNGARYFSENVINKLLEI